MAVQMVWFCLWIWLEVVFGMCESILFFSYSHCFESRGKLDFLVMDRRGAVVVSMTRSCFTYLTLTEEHVSPPYACAPFHLVRLILTGPL
jgi:hypothetical protein